MLITLCVVMTAIGILIGSKKLKKNSEYPLINKIQIIAIVVLIFFMGVKIGSDERVIETITSIGLNAFIITILTITFSCGVVFITRCLLGFDKKGRMLNDKNNN